jgi:hypothetical protein
LFIRFIPLPFVLLLAWGCETPMQPKHLPLSPLAKSSSQLTAYGNTGVGASEQDASGSGTKDSGVAPGGPDVTLFWDYGLND